MECDPRFASAWANIAFPPKLPSQLLEGLLELEKRKSVKCQYLEHPEVVTGMRTLKTGSFQG